MVSFNSFSLFHHNIHHLDLIKIQTYITVYAGSYNLFIFTLFLLITKDKAISKVSTTTMAKVFLKKTIVKRHKVLDKLGPSSRTNKFLYA